MSAIRDSLQYRPSPYSLMDHIHEANAILEACRLEWPILLPYLLEPSNVLVLGAMRAVSPYVSFGPHAAEAQSPEFAQFLRRFGLELVREEDAYAADAEMQRADPTFLLIHTGALGALTSQYEAVADWWAKQPLSYDPHEYLAWYTHNIYTCAGALEKGVLPRHWLADWWAPHNICFGMLLGYPGTAICSMLAAGMVEHSLQVGPKMHAVTFVYPQTEGAEVSYLVQVHDKDSRQVAGHRERWQKFFDAIYEVWSPTGAVPTSLFG